MNIWKSYILTADKDMNTKAIFAVMNNTWAVVKIRPEKNSDLYRIWTHDLCDTGIVEVMGSNPLLGMQTLFILFVLLLKFQAVKRSYCG